MVFLFSQAVSAQEALTVKDIIKLALENNHDIKIARNNLEIAENNAGVMNSGYLPSLNAGGGVSKSQKDTYLKLADSSERNVDNAGTESYNYALTLNYTLFDGMGRHYTYKKLKTDFSIAELQSRSVIEGTLMQLILSYYEYANLISQLENQKRTLQISTDRVARAQSQFEYGQAGKLELLQSQVDRNNDSINYINIQNSLLIAQRNINVILARDVRADIMVDTNVVFNQDVDEFKMMELAIDQNVDYLLAKENVILTNYQKKSNRSGFMPKIDLNGSYSGNRSLNDVGFALESETQGIEAGARLSWNLFDGGRTHTQVQNAKIRELNAQEKEVDERRKLERRVSNAFVLYQNSIFVMEAQEKNMETSRMSFEYSKEKFELGQLGFLDFRKTQVDLQDAINNYNNAKYTAKVAELQLMRLAGLFVQEIEQ